MHFPSLQLLSMDSFPVISLSLALDFELLSDLSSGVWLMFSGGDHWDNGAVRLAIENGRGKE